MISDDPTELENEPTELENEPELEEDGEEESTGPPPIPEGYVQVVYPDGRPYLDAAGAPMRVPRGTRIIDVVSPADGVRDQGYDWTPRPDWSNHPGPGYV